uniref:Resolvase domain protein n=1 Tax=Rhizobium rhizogenes TaxID=359 RepID=A0A7S4ZTV0_RHIRH|nr:resolvase domain protein [Rhizobium rhizogenes]
MEMAFIDPGRKQGIPLQGYRLAIVTTRHPHVTDQHVRQTSNQELPHSLTFRQGLSRKK